MDTATLKLAMANGDIDLAELFNVESDEWRDLQASLYGRSVRAPRR